MKTEWTEKLKNKLEGHRKTPPAGLWQDICNQMGLAPEPVHRPRFVGWWRWAAAACVVALLGLLAYLHKGEQESPSKPSVAAIRKTPSEATTKPMTERPSLALTRAEAPRRTKKGVKHPQKEMVETQEEYAISPATADNWQDSTDTRNVEDNQTLIAEQTSPSDSDNSQSSILHSQSSTLHSQSSILHSQSSILYSQSSSWTIGMEASGQLLAMQSRIDAKDFDIMAGFHVDDPEENTGHTEVTDSSANVRPNSFMRARYKGNARYKHHPPVRAGLSFQYQLNPRLSLFSGISYTYLHSRITYPDNAGEVLHQNLHYIGLPLGASCRIWSSNRFAFYASARVMLEKCVNDKPWQWSVGAALGAEYRFKHQLGLYLEPSLSYYFDDHTSLQHYYKEYPIAFSLEIGLRLHIGK